jgi:hypothetical protein
MLREGTTVELYEFVLENLPSAPIAKRARLCRTLAVIIGDEPCARELNAQAARLEAIDQDHGQLLLAYRRGGAA